MLFGWLWHIVLCKNIFKVRVLERVKRSKKKRTREHDTEEIPKSRHLECQVLGWLTAGSARVWLLIGWIVQEHRSVGLQLEFWSSNV